MHDMHKKYEYKRQNLCIDMVLKKSIKETLFLVDLFSGDENSLKETYEKRLFDRYDFPDFKKINAMANNKYGETKQVRYKPPVIRGVGVTREGLCSYCKKWFRLKTSSYWYHMNYKHGISARGEICPEPKLRERSGKKEGFCKECNAWIELGSKNRSVKFGWFKHWQKTHLRGRTI